MGDVWPQLVLVGALVLLNALFAGSEMALVSLREGQLQRLENRSSTGAVLARLARDPNRFLATIQIGITFAGFLASASAAVSLAEPLEGPLGFLGGAAGPGSIFVVTIILSYLTLVLGELAPKRLAMQRAEQWAMLVARPLSFLAKATRPLVWLLSRSTDVVVGVLGGDPRLEREAVTEEEIRDMVATQVAFTPQQRQIIGGAFEIAERTLSEILRPRRSVFTLDESTPCRDALPELAASSHSRAPVCTKGSLDDVVGVVHMRDLLVDDPLLTTGQVSAPALIFPETMGALDALRELQVQRTQMAIVVNEHGGAEGIVTVEDLVEELVGEIYDETDRDVLGVRHESDGSVVLSGRFPVHDLSDIGIDVPEGDYATIAGFVLDRLGHLPKVPGDSVVHDRWRFTVTGVDQRAVSEVVIEEVPTIDDLDDDGE